MSVVISLSVALAPVNSNAGQYQQKCQQAGQSAQQQCQGAIGGANGGDMGQASGLASTVGASSSVNPGAGGMSSQAMGQMGRLSQATGQCEQAKEQCEQQCDQQKQSAQQDKKAQQQGEPAQVSQAKESSCSQPMASMIGPLLMALAAAMAALMAAKASEGKSDAAQYPVSTATPTQPGKPQETPPPATGTAEFFAEPAVKKAVATIKAAGGNVSSKGVTMPNGEYKAFSALAGAGGGGSGALSGASAAAQGLTAAGAGETGFRIASTGKIDGESGEGGASNSGSQEEQSSEGDPYGFNPGRNPKSVRGLTVNYAGEPIGTRGENIWEMVSRAYTRKRNNQVFLEGDGAIVNWPIARAPASRPRR